MTAADIVERLFTEKATHNTHDELVSRVRKAKGLAVRQRIDWADVLAAMTPEQRAMVDSL